MRLRAIPIAAALALGTITQAQAATTQCRTVAACALYANLGPGPGGAGVEAEGQNSIGLLGVSNANVAIYGRSSLSYGMQGITLGGVGVAGVYGDDESTSDNDYAVLATSRHGIAFAAAVDNGYVLQADNDSSSGGTTVVAIDSSGNEYLGGDEYLLGTLTQGGETDVRTRSTSGVDLTTYGARSASPTLEDFGTATLHDGVATVTLEKTFASTIAPGFMVFVTPHGDSNSLYTVASKTGFTVHESKGGRSTLSFDYRIVAKPLDAMAKTRLAVMAAPRKMTAVVKAARR